VQPIDPDHSGHGVDVHEHCIGVEQLLQAEIDEPDLRAPQQDPRYCEENARDHQRDDGEREEHRLERRIRALIHPGERSADHERERRRADGKLQRIGE
jgi:hypothetical protein